jgi:hypothetical protein
MSEHSARCEEWHDDLAAYALDALETNEADRVEAHLAGCSSCTERLRWLQPAIDMLPVTVAQMDPSADLRERLMSTVRAEDAPAPVQSQARPAPAPARRRRLRLPVFGDLGLRPALAGFGVFLLLVAGVAGYALNDEGGTGSTSERTYAARSLEGNGLMGGTLVVDGDKGSLEVNGMPPNKGNQVYQAWIRESPAEGGSVKPSSVFVVSGDGTGSVGIPRGLDDAAEVMVTREPKGGSQHPSESPLISAVIR